MNPKYIGYLIQGVCTPGPNLVILDRTGDKLSSRTSSGLMRTRTHTDAGNHNNRRAQNWPRVKIASTVYNLAYHK